MNLPRWLPVALGVLLGLAGGLYYAWLVNPVEYVETAPESLRQDFRQDYLALIGAAYAGTGDLARARARLALFPGLDPETELPAIAQQRFAAGLSDASALAQLASDLVKSSPGSPTQTASAVRPTTTATRRPPTATPRPSPTSGAPFRLAEREAVCDPNLTEPLIQVEVLDAAGEPVPGMQVLIVWDTGQDHFFTGLKPELGLGYGDFTMTEGVTYTLRLGEAGPPVTSLSAESCAADDGPDYLGSWYLRFEQQP